MTKGIRAYTKQVFAEMLADRAELGNTQFRQEVIARVVMAFDIKPTAAATHYNHALKEAKAIAPELVEGLGRPEDKKGGRKKKEVALPAASPAVEAVAEPIVEQTAEPVEVVAETQQDQTAEAV